MTASEILAKTTPAMEEGQRDLYIFMAEQEIRSYLNYPDDMGLEKFVTTVAAIAFVFFHESQKPTKPAGIKSESRTDGGSSESVTYETDIETHKGYEEAIQAELTKIARYRLPRVPGEIKSE